MKHSIRRQLTELYMYFSFINSIAILAIPIAALAAEKNISQKTIWVTDVVGRVVEVPANVRRIILGEGRLIYALAPLEKDHLFDRVVGMQGEFRKTDEAVYEELVKRFPKLPSIRLIGQSTPDSVSPEGVLRLHPDLAILTVSGHGPGRSSPLLKQLEAADIPYIFVDFRAQPIINTVPSMRAIGAAINRPTEAENFIDFYQLHMNRVSERLQNIASKERPTVFLEMLAGARESCCHTVGDGNMGALIQAAGGRNIVKDIIPGVIGDISLEKVITSNPDIYIADGTKSVNSLSPGLKMGARVSFNEALVSLKNIVNRRGFATLDAIKGGHFYGIWHSFYAIPFNFMAVETMAKWFYPERFKDINPDKTLKEFYERFMPIPLNGTYWVNPATVE